MKRQIDRRRLLQAAGSLAALPLIGLGSAHADTPKITSFRTTAKSWLYIAEDYAIGNGQFTRAGVTVDSIVNGRGVLVDILLGESCDLILVSPSQVLRARAARRPVKIIGRLIDRYASHVVLKKSIMAAAGVAETSDALTKAKLLKGLRIATPGPGAGADTLVRYLADQAGLNAERNLTIVPIPGGPGAMLAAFDKGVVDGFCFSSPTSDMAVAKFGGAYLFQMSLNPPPFLANYPYMVLAVREASLRDNRAALRAYVAGLRDGKQRMRADPAGYRAWAKGFLEGMEDGVFDAAFASDGAIALADMAIPEPEFLACRDFVQWEFKRLQINADVGTLRYADCVDLSLLREVAP